MKTQEIMEEVRSVSSIYESLAVAMAGVYFSLERLADVSSLYQFSLDFFLEIIERVLSPAKDPAAIAAAATAAAGGGGAVGVGVAATAAELKAAAVRVKALSGAFFGEVSRRVMRGLKFHDKLMFLVRLGQVGGCG